MRWFEVAAKTLPALSKNDYATCESLVGDAMRALPDSPFHAVLKADFTNAPENVARTFDAFATEQFRHFQLAAIYTETNGFDINPDRWYCDIFGYDKDGGIEDPDWLSDWQSEDWPDITLFGMEQLQEIYETEKLGGEEADTASLMIVIKFQKLIYNAKQHMEHCDIPIYATGHDYDFFAKC